ncbi:MAG: hypothetical protein K0R47_4430 [Brevibacillus sp.]|jgi:hypothetical protein|nr:hypothetical protein [Brevibacillus sp.]
MNAAVQPIQTPKPFSKELDPSLCYEFRGHREASARLDLMIQHRTLGVLTGEVGGGKSTLIRRLFASLNPMTYLPIYLCYATLKPREFYVDLLEAVGVEPVYTVSGHARSGRKSSAAGLSPVSEPYASSSTKHMK